MLIVEEGEKPLKLTVVVNKAGEFAQTLLQKVENMNKVNELKVIGPLNGEDLNKFKEMEQMAKLDLLDAKITDIPAYFCGDIEYINSTRSSGCYLLSEVALPNVNSIGSNAFHYCTHLKKITIPSSVTSIPDGCFSGCSSLSQISLHDGITSIGSWAFSNSGIERITIPSSVTSIPDGCFSGCSSLSQISLHDGITSIDRYAFSNSSLKSVIIPKSVNSIGYRAFYKTALTSIKLPGVKTIGSEAFENCKYLTNVQFAEGLESLGNDPFRGCKALTEIELPSSVKLFRRGIFALCERIKKITCHAITPPMFWSGTIMNGVDKTNVMLHVPAMSVEKYRKSYAWKTFCEIVPTDTSMTDIEISNSFTIGDEQNLAKGCNINLSWDALYDDVYIDNNNVIRRTGSINYIGRTKLVMGNYTQRHCLGSNYIINEHYKKQCTSLVANGPMSADSVCVTMTIPSGEEWHFISLPYDVNVSDITYPDGVQFVIRKYSGANRAQREGDTWQNLTSNSVMHAYEGYIIRCNKQDVTFTFPAIKNKNKNNVFSNSDAKVPLKEYQSEFEHNCSWNLVGNPYPCFYDIRRMNFKAPITVYNRYRGTYDAYSPVDDSYILHPTQAFFVQCPTGMTSILFDESGRQTDTTVKNLGAKSLSKGFAGNSTRRIYNVVLSDGEAEDHTRFVINNDATMNYELDKDAAKFIDGNNTAMLVYTVEDGVRYAINERPLDKKIVHLGYYAPADGEYTLSLNTKQSDDILLVDTENNTQTPLVGDVRFNATTGFNDSRFVLVMGGDVTGIETAEEATSQWSIANGVVIAKEPFEIYTVEGRLVGKYDTENSAKLSAGIYLLNIKNIKHKIIVK